MTKFSEETLIDRKHLLDFGMVDCFDDIFVMKKGISIPSEAEDDIEGELAIGVCNMYNVFEIALSLPDGAILFFNCNSMEKLLDIENSISRYVPNF